MNEARSVLALSGGVGGAKLALGLAHCLEPEKLTIVCNTGDDFVHLGLTICPDLDTVLYTLADWSNKEQGWGQADETWSFLDALGRLNGETWFSLGDRDLATHIVRTTLLQEGLTLSEIVTELCGRMNIPHKVAPMSDQTVSTRVRTRSGEDLMFQHYFVRDRCEPEVAGFEFAGIDQAMPSPAFSAALADCEVVIICPSNPFVSVDPILALPGVTEALSQRNVPVVVVSNIVGGQALKGPAAKMMNELGMPMTALGVARHYLDKYDGLISGFVLDHADAELAEPIQALGLSTIVTKTVMVTLQDKIDLGREVLAFADAS